VKWEEAAALRLVIEEFDRPGGVVQWRLRGSAGGWRDIKAERIDLVGEEYRIKPKARECWVHFDATGFAQIAYPTPAGGMQNAVHMREVTE